MSWHGLDRRVGAAAFVQQRSVRSTQWRDEKVRQLPQLNKLLLHCLECVYRVTLRSNQDTRSARVWACVCVPCVFGVHHSEAIV